MKPNDIAPELFFERKDDLTSEAGRRKLLNDTLVRMLRQLEPTDTAEGIMVSVQEEAVEILHDDLDDEAYEEAAEDFMHERNEFENRHTRRVQALIDGLKRKATK